MNATLKAACRQLHTSTPQRLIYDSILDTIGRTPVVKANKVLSQNAKENGVQLFAKLEFFNPLSSIKDRLAVAMIDAAEKSGDLKAGQTVIEATSGNTGIGLAMVCAKKGYPFVAVMVDSFSIDARKIMRALGAKVIITPTFACATGMVIKAKELAMTHGWYMARQFANEANAPYHANTTGPEILQDFAGKRLDYWVTGYGTGGTFTGAGSVIRTGRPEIKIILAEPENSPLLASGKRQGCDADGIPFAVHPSYNPHLIQGWTPNFIPKVCQEGVDLELHDRIVLVKSEEGVGMARRLAKEEGIFTGISGGATTAVGCKIAESAPHGSVILVMLADTQERYRSSAIYEGIGANMNEEEIAISKSTPSLQLESTVPLAETEKSTNSICDLPSLVRQPFPSLS